MEDDLEQQVAEFIAQGRHVFALDRLGDLVGLLQRIGQDGAEGLLQIPGTAVLGIAQARHDGDESVDRWGVGHGNPW
jgi:hypothetical protein